MKVYIQQSQGQFQDDWVFDAYLGFSKLGADLKYFDELDIDRIPCLGGREMVVVTGVENTLEYFELNNIEAPKPFNIPEELMDSYFIGRNREIKIMTMGQFKASVDTPIFVKPHGRVKEFPSGVLTENASKDLILFDVTDDTMVMASTVVNMESEYRCFVYNGKLVGVKHYQGDFRLFPDLKVVEEAIKHFKSAPVAYTVDVAVVQTPYNADETVVIECQDLWAIGNYNFDCKLYAQMLRDRWFEIVNKK